MNLIKKSKFLFPNKSINCKLYSFIKYNFSKENKTNNKEIKDKLLKEGAVKIYDSKYTFTSEKLLVRSSVIFLIVSSNTILFTNVSYLLKAINLVVLFAPSLLILIEAVVSNTRFIKCIRILPENKIEVTNMWGKQEILKIEDLNKADFDKRVEKQRPYLNNETFIIFTNKNNSALYHVPRDGAILNEDLLHDILEGRKLI